MKHLFNLNKMVIILLILTSAIIGCDDDCDDCDPDTQQTQDKLLQLLLDERVDRFDVVPGGALAVIRPNDDALVFTTGFSDKENQVVMEKDATFRIGSVTKTFTALATMQLAQSGEITLDQTIEELLPGILGEQYHPQEITVRHLLNHTAGVFSFTGDVMNWMVPYLLDPSVTFTPLELIGIANLYQPTGPIGSEWHYSNTHYILLGLIIEDVTGNTWEEEVRTRFIDPLGLQHTTVPETGDESMPSGYAHGYTNLYIETGGAAGGDSLVEFSEIEPSTTWSSGNMISSVGDLARWAKAIAEGELLNDEYQGELLTFFDVSDNIKMGLGIVREADYRILGHRGQIEAYDCAMMYMEDLGISTASCVNSQIQQIGPEYSNVELLVMYDAFGVLREELPAIPAIQEIIPGLRPSGPPLTEY